MGGILSETKASQVLGKRKLMCGSGMVHRGWEAVAMGIIAGVRRETGQVLGERPSDCPRQWAGERHAY